MRERLREVERERDLIKAQLDLPRSRPEITDADRRSVRETLAVALKARAAEGIRIRSEERLTLGVAVRGRVFRDTTFKNRNSCSCFKKATKILDSPGNVQLSEAEGYG